MSSVYNIFERLESGGIQPTPRSTNATNPSPEAIGDAIQMLKNDSDLTIAFTHSTADEEQLTKRLTAAKEVFARI